MGEGLSVYYSRAVSDFTCKHQPNKAGILFGKYAVDPPVNDQKGVVSFGGRWVRWGVGGLAGQTNGTSSSGLS